MRRKLVHCAYFSLLLTLASCGSGALKVPELEQAPVAEVTGVITVDGEPRMGFASPAIPLDRIRRMGLRHIWWVVRPMKREWLNFK